MKVENKKINIIPSASEMSDRDEILAKAYKDLIFFGRVFLPQDFLHKSESPQFHHDLAKKLIQHKPGARICNVIPRGMGKSILSKAAIMHKFLFAEEDKQNFVAWVSEEQGQSVDHLKYIRHHFEENEIIRYYFGNMDGGSVGKRWTEKDIVTPKGDRIIAKGSAQRLRGRAEVGVRYTGIILDDFESELNTKTPDRRAELKKWIVSTVFPSLEETPGNEGWIWLTGTIVHYDSFLQNIVDGWKEAKNDNRNYPWDLTFHRAIEDGKPLWKDQFPLSKLENKRKEFIEAGLVNKFAQEYMNDARDSASAAFKVDRLQYYNHKFEVRDRFCYLVDNDEAIPINVYIGVDLAATATKTSDYQVILVMGIDANKNRYILDYFREKIPAFDMAEQIVEMARKYSPVRRVSIETVAAQEMVRDMTSRISVADKRLMPGIFKGVKPPYGIKKEDRLETTLGPIVNSKKLYIKKHMTEIVDELFEHPKPKNDDLMDALYYADYFAKAPSSTAIDAKNFKNRLEKQVNIKKNKVYNWITGSID